MNIMVEQITDKLRTLPEDSLKRVLAYIEALSENKLDIEIPQWQQTIVAERLSEYQNNPNSAIDGDRVFEDIEKDLK